jgi:hypothetical protein
VFFYGFPKFSFEQWFTIFYPLEPYLKFVVWVEKDIIFQNMHLKLLKLSTAAAADWQKKILKTQNFDSNAKKMILDKLFWTFLDI